MPLICVVLSSRRCWNEAPKSADLGLAVGRQQDVARLDVAVDDAVLVRVLERADALEDDLDHLADRQQPVARRVLLQRAARHVLHHQVAAVRLDHRVVDVDDVRVVELAGERGFGDERLVHARARSRYRAPRANSQHLDRDVALGERVARKVDVAGGAAADLADHRVLADRLLRLRLLDFHARAYFGRRAAAARLRRRACRGSALTPSWRRLVAVLLRGARRDDDDRHALGARVAAHVAREVEAVHARHLDVDQHHLRQAVSPSARGRRRRPWR